MSPAEEEDLEKLRKMSRVQLTEEYERRLRQELAAAIVDLPKTVTATVQNAARDIICGYLGFRKGFYGQWEFDMRTSNSLAVELGHLALTQVQQALPDFIGELATNTVVSKKKLYALVKREYKRKFYETFQLKMYDALTAATTEHAETYLQEISKGIPETLKGQLLKNSVKREDV